MKQLALRLSLSVSLCLFLTQCSSLTSGGGREGRLKRLGFEEVALQKIPGDVRYSGEFRVNGRPLRFLIDSGANSTDLDRKLAESVKVKPLKGVKVITRGALGRKVTNGRGTALLEIGPMISENFPFTLTPKQARQTSTSSYAGQVGLDALTGTGAMVDIPGARLWVPGVKYLQSRNQRSVAPGFVAGLGDKALPLSSAGRLPHLVLRGTLQGKSVTWVVDTGAEVSVMAQASFDRFGIPSFATNARMVDASGDRIPLRRARLRGLTFGEVVVTEFDISIAPLKAVQEFFRDDRGRPIDGILGMDFLDEGQALLDAGSGLLYLGHP